MVASILRAMDWSWMLSLFYVLFYKTKYVFFFNIFLVCLWNQVLHGLLTSTWFCATSGSKMETWMIALRWWFSNTAPILQLSIGKIWFLWSWVPVLQWTVCISALLRVSHKWPQCVLHVISSSAYQCGGAYFSMSMRRVAEYELQKGLCWTFESSPHQPRMKCDHA